jgi:ATPase subunit of ABC transporter with duplicated ATPase domains
MPSITLSGLTATTPDGRTLFSNLDLSFDAGRTALVGRNGVGKTTLLDIIAGTQLPQTGSVSRTGTIGVLRQRVQVSAQETLADLMGVAEALDLLRRADEGVATVEELASADWALEARIATALARVGLDASLSTLLSALSGGQRTRAALCALVLAEPDFILLDEPTNNLDREGRASVIELLRTWRAGAIVVSHDRELLETMDAIVEITSLDVTRYGGNWSHYRERRALELAAARQDLAEAERRVAEAARAAQANVERKARKDGAGQRKRAKGDMPCILAGARQNRAQATSGDHARIAERRRLQAVKDAFAARQRIEVLEPLSVALPSTGLPAGRTVLYLDSVSAGYGAHPSIIERLSVAITGPERVAVTGPNGSGKSTLLALVTGRLTPRSGSVRVNTDCAMLDQEVSVLDASLSIRDNFLRLNPGADENACRGALARFMFRADAALQIVSTLSGGQLLRAGLACVLGGTRPPALLILDEPTNHLDIESIEAVEAGLRAYDGALLVVSHDEPFLEAIEITRRFELPRPRGRTWRWKAEGEMPA